LNRVNEAGTYEIEDGIAVITVDSPPVNALSVAVRAAIVDGLRRAHSDRAVGAVVLICAGRTFIAGADLSELGKPPRPPSFEDMIEALENGPKPVVAAIHGTGLGGGFETALLCHYRVAVPSAKLGLPEVLLGLMPGGGGTQRLPRIVGVEAALDLIVTGRQVGAAEAQKLGILDAVLEEDQLRAGALAFARNVVAANRQLRRVRDREEMLETARGRPEIFETYRQKNQHLFRGVKAPGYILEAVRNALVLPFDEGVAKERALINALLAGRESAALRYLFFAKREAAKISGLQKDVAPAPIHSVAILGSGPAAVAVAPLLTRAGLTVTELAPQQSPEAAADLIAVTAGADFGRIAQATGRAGQVIGLRVSNRLLELCRGADTAVETTAAAMQLGRKTGKIAVLCKGDFISDRMTSVQFTVTELLKSDGVSADEISAVRYEYGFPGSPPPPDCSLTEARAQFIREALLFPLINTGAALLAEGAVQRASDIDAAMVAGFGWPAYTGGPMFWAATGGLPQVVAGLARLRRRFGDAFRATALLEELANTDRNFQSEDRNG
jgi:enoyl-CoA hydratase/carnithine racemase